MYESSYCLFSQPVNTQMKALYLDTQSGLMFLLVSIINGYLHTSLLLWWLIMV